MRVKWRNFKLLVKSVWDYQPSLFLLIIIKIALDGVVPYFQLLLSAQVIDWLIQGLAIETYLMQLLLWIIPLTLAMLGQKVIDSRLTLAGKNYRLVMSSNVQTAFITMDFPLTIGAEAAKLLREAMMLSDHDTTLFGRLLKEWNQLGGAILALILYIGTLAQLEIQFVILVVLMLVGLVIFKIFTLKNQKKVFPSKAKNYRQLNYLDKTMGDQRIAKDIRLYQMSEWFEKIQGQLKEEFDKIRIPEIRLARGEGLFVNLLLIVMTAMAYQQSLLQIQNGQIPVAQFVVYVGLVSLVTNTLMQLITLVAQFNQSLTETSYYFDIMNQPNVFNHGEGILPPAENEEITIELKNVTYTYPNSDEPTFQKLNLTIHPNEKLALVGENGAGKTTLAKLILGLLDPDEGKILINGQSRNVYNIHDYYQLFAPVFQDNYLFTYSIKETVIQGQPFEEAKYQRVLSQSGLKEMIDKTPKGDETKIMRQIYPEAVVLSGGQMQKLKLAQALYKDSPILILDEPTAALDPISEYEIYQQYQHFAENKISIFISHRLASTHFCDRIIYLNQGRIIEEGTHDELLAADNGYANLFHTQAHYYQENLDEEDEEEIIKQGGII